MTANTVKAAFSQFSNNIYVLEDCPRVECLKIIPTEKYAYFVEPDILHWEDRATEWSGMPDRIELKISVYDVALGAEIASAVIVGKANGQPWVAITHKTYYPILSTYPIWDPRGAHIAVSYSL